MTNQNLLTKPLYNSVRKRARGYIQPQIEKYLKKIMYKNMLLKIC